MLLLLLLLLELVLMLFCASDVGSDFIMDDGLVVTAYDIDAEFLGTEISWEGKRARMGHTTM